MEKGKNTIQEVDQFRIDCMYGKKKHYNASHRYASYHRFLGIVIVVLTTFMGTSVYYSLSASEVVSAKVVVGILTVLIAILVSLQTYFNFEKRALNHKVTADRYLWLMKEAKRLLSYYNDGSKTLDEVQKELERLSQKVMDIQRDEPVTSNKDYEDAKKGIANGEEEYS